MPNFTLIETLFERLILELVDIFSELELNEVRDFFDAGEYGLALETVADIFLEEGKTATDEVATLVRDLATTMNLTSDKHIKPIIQQGLPSA